MRHFWGASCRRHTDKAGTTGPPRLWSRPSAVEDREPRFLLRLRVSTLILSKWLLCAQPVFLSVTQARLPVATASSGHLGSSKARMRQRRECPSEEPSMHSLWMGWARPWLRPQTHPHSCLSLRCAASGASAAGTPCQQLLESTLGSKANPFPASMETRLKTRLPGPTVVHPEDFSAARENSRLGLHRDSRESSLRALRLLLKQHPWAGAGALAGARPYRMPAGLGTFLVTFQCPVSTSIPSTAAVSSPSCAA